MKALRLLCLALVGLALLAPGVVRGQAAEPQPMQSAIAVIQDAEAAGQISASQALLYKMYALFRPEKLPLEFRVANAQPFRCGTPTVMEILPQLGTMPEGQRREAQEFFTRPSLNAYIDTDHFRIHYSTSGGNMLYGWPNTTFRDSIASSAEYSYRYFQNHGWVMPPSDGGMGGNDKYDIYCDNLGGSAMGVTYPENNIGTPYPNTWSSYVIIERNMGQFGDAYMNMKVTVAHEFHHAIQMGLNGSGGASWFMENTATSLEDQVYDELNQYIGYLRAYFGLPYKSQRYMNGQFEYACSIWATYLGERFSYPVVKNIWVNYAVNNNLTSAFDTEIGNMDPNFNWDLATNQWARWNVFTCDRADANHYSEGGLWRDPSCIVLVFDKDINTYPQTDVHPSANKLPEGLGTSFTRFRKETGSTDNMITISVTALNACDYNHKVFFVRKASDQTLAEEYVVPIDASGNATFELTRWDLTEWMLMGVEMKRACGSSGKDYKFSAETSFTMDVAQGMQPTRLIRLDQNTPNPFNPLTTIKFATYASAPVRVDVFDAGGRHVRTLLNSTQSAGEHQLKWFGDDDAGRQVATGLYLYSVQVGKEKATRKMLMIE